MPSARFTPKIDMEPSFAKYWHFSKLKNTKGIFLLLHGLNLKIERMNAICDILTHEGYDVFCPPLTCHRAEEDNLALQKSIKSSQWLSDFHQYYQHLTDITDEKINIAAFSLGAAVALNYLAMHKPGNIGKLILIEPATQLSMPLKVLIWLSKHLRISKGVGIPSSNLPSYRVEESTSVAAYQALSTLDFGSIKNGDFEYLTHLDAIVIIECKSEAIAIKKASEDFERLRWRVVIVSNRAKNNVHPIFKWIKPTIHHLIIDESVTDQQCWKQIRESMVNHLRC